MTENQSYLDKYGRFSASQAWQEGKAPIVRFVTDDEKVVGMMFTHITRTYEDRILKALMVSGPVGVVVVRGPEVAAYHNKLAQGLADLVRANGKEITSVLYYPPQDPGSANVHDEEEIEAETELERLD
jgi:hypothetical protein